MAHIFVRSGDWCVGSLRCVLTPHSYRSRDIALLERICSGVDSAAIDVYLEKVPGVQVAIVVSANHGLASMNATHSTSRWANEVL